MTQHRWSDPPSQSPSRWAILAIVVFLVVGLAVKAYVASKVMDECQEKGLGFFSCIWLVTR